MSEQNPLAHITADANQLDALDQSGFTSAFQIATLSQSRFVRQHGAQLGGDDQAAAIHRRAVSRVELVTQRFLSQHTLVEETYYEVPIGRTIFSPAAYLVDLVRFIENFVNDEHVPAAQKLFSRRPDLDSLMLDHETTGTMLPKLEIVNDILEAHLAQSLSLASTSGEITRDSAHDPRGSVYPHLARQAYGFRPPFHLPLAQLRAALALLKTDLVTICRAFTPAASLPRTAVSGEVLTLSPEAVAVCATPKPTKGDLQIAYGLTSDFDSYFSIDPEIPGDESLIVHIDIFLSVTKLSSEELTELINGNLSTQEIEKRGQAWLFINADNFGSAPVTLEAASNRVTHLSLSRLDRIHRFTLLAKHLGWSLSDLDWVLRIANPLASAIDDTSLAVIAQLVEWQNRFQRPVSELSSLIGVLKNEGVPQPGQISFKAVFQPRSLHGDVTLQPDERMWTFEPNNTEQRKTSLALAAALGLSEADLALVARLVSTAFGEQTRSGFGLGLEQLSAFYRLSRLPQLLNISLSDMLSLLGLMGDDHIYTLAGAAGFGIAASINELIAYQQWIQAANIPLDMLRYILTGSASDTFSARLEETRIINFLGELTSSGSNSDPASKDALKVLENHLADLMGVSAQMITRLIDWANATRSLSDTEWLELLSPYRGTDTLVDEVGLSSSLVDHLTQIHRYACLITLLRITDAESAFVLEQPAFFNIPNVNRLTLADVRSIYKFKWLVYNFQDRQNGLIAYLKAANPTVSKPELAAALQIDVNTLGSDALDSLNPDDYTLSFMIISDHDHLPDAGSASIVVGLTRRDEIYVRIFDAAGNILTLDDAQALRFDNREDSAPIYLAAERALGNNGAIDEPTKVEVIDKLLSKIRTLWNELIQRKIINRRGGILVTSQDAVSLSERHQAYAPQIWSLFETKVNQPNAVRELARLTQWDSEQNQHADLTALMGSLWNDAQGGTADSKPPFGTVAGVLQMKLCVDLMGKTGLSWSLLRQIQQQLTSSPQGAASDAYQALADTAHLVLAAVKARYGDTDWGKVYQPIQVDLNERKRDALVDAVIIRHALAGIDLRDRRDLYGYLLIDVETGGLVETSRLVEGLASLQLYIYRCQMQLEQAVTLGSDFEQYWNWIKSYRVWEANRKVFLYPENYIQPDLRKHKTALFAQLEQNLQQAHITPDSVDKAVKTYLDGFAEVANLKYAGSYAAPTGSRANPYYPDRTLYLVGRSHYPYKYYYRTAVFIYDSGDQAYAPIEWQPWVNITLSIPAKYPSPIYAFDKLFIFWAEIKPAAARRDSEGKMTGKRFEAHLQFSHQDFSGNWAASQPLGEPILLPETVNSKAKAESPDWQRIFLSYDGVAQQIVVTYPGLFTCLDVTLKQVIPSPIVTLISGLNETARPPELDTHVMWMPKRAVEFDGAPPLVTHPLDLGNVYTFAVWVRVPGTDAASIFINPDNGPSMSFDRLGHYVYVYNNSRTNAANVVVTSINLYEWTHITLTVSADSQKIYVNGELQNTVSIGDMSIRGELQIGSFFSGAMSQLFIFPATLSDEQVRNLSQALPLDLKIQDHQPREFLNAPADTQVYPVTNASSWYVYDTGKSEYLQLDTRWIRLNSTTIHALSSLLASGIDNLFTLDAQRTAEDFFGDLQPVNADAFPSSTLDLYGANGLYYWELFFHTPFLVAYHLNTAQQFEEAQKWYRYIFDPAAGTDGAGNRGRFVGLPSDTLSDDVNADLRNEAQLETYYRDPFDPHAIAHLRPVAYQRAVRMHYIDNLINWADQLFQQDTRETLVEATLLYIMAYDLLGKKPVKLGESPLARAETMGSLKKVFPDGKIPEFLTKVEKTADAGRQSPNAKANPNNTIASVYFGVPKNDYYYQYWDRVEQRLHNIRFNLTIDGKPNNLPLFQPPISPEQLIQAVASGQGISQTLALAAMQPPYYRFSVMLEKAKSAASTVIQFGAALLSALEKADAEQLSRLRSTHEQVLLRMNRLARENQIQIAKAGLEGLKHGLSAAAARKSYYENLIQKRLLEFEQNQINLENDAIDRQEKIEAIKIGVALAYLVPTVYGLADGDLNPGDAANQAVQVIETNANIKTQQANVMSVNAQFARRAEEWAFQHSQIEAEIEQMNYQIEGATRQIEIAVQDLAQLETNLLQSSEIDAFLKTKYTNTELYQWMVGKLSALYFQCYQLALDLALSTEKAWQFEKGHTQTIIQRNIWNDLYQGLLAGEALMLNLHQLEKAYLDQWERRLEIVKTIPISSLD